ncbi:MAG: hypothetical protein VKI82_09240 [Leptolyngbya sp.]|nr:hypothetical protein [Leptolyngbya sp.]
MGRIPVPPIQRLVLGRPTEVVEAVWVRGRPLVDQGQLLTVNLASLHQVLRHPPGPLPEARTQHQSLEPHYREVMVNRPEGDRRETSP